MGKLSSILITIFSVILILFTNSCRENYTPKPPGYLRIDYPEKKYRVYDLNPSFRFEYPEYGLITRDSASKAREGWLNVNLPSLNGIIYLNYRKINDNLSTYIDDSRTLAYKHTIKAESIEENLISNPSQKVYGIFYDIRGNTASSIQFFVTDSIKHFLRGSLYFNAQPNQDSLAPVISFVRKDIDHMIKTLEWK